MNNTITIKVKKSIIEKNNDEQLLNEVKRLLTTSDEFTETKEIFKKYLISKELITTKERVKILETIYKEKNKISASQIHEKLIKDFQVCYRTIINTLVILTDAGIIQQIKVNDRKVYYKLV